MKQRLMKHWAQRRSFEWKSTAAVVLCVSLTGALTACGRADRQGPSDTAALQQPPGTVSRAPKDTVPGAGRLQWSLSDLQEALTRAGVSATSTGSVKQPFMGPTGMRYRLRDGELQAYLYADAVALARDTDKLDTVTVSPPTMKINWVMPPSLIIENNLALILLTRDPRLKEEIVRAVKTKKTSHGGEP